MAITAATLTTTVSDSITLNGTTYGNTITKTHASVKVVRQQTVTVPTSMVTLYESADAASGSTFDEDLIVYARITNTDSTNFIGLHIITDTGQEAIYKLNAGCTFVLNAHADAFDTEDDVSDANPDITAEDFSSATGNDIVKISADANTASVDVEVLIAATG
jgi:hypothetical protein